MSARLSLEEIPYISWKGKTFSQISASLRRNGLFNSSSSNIIPTLALKAQPIKIYRKEIASIPLNSCNPRTSIKLSTFETPGNNIVNSSVKPSKYNGLTNTIDSLLPSNSGEFPGSGCDDAFSGTSLENKCLSTQNNALRRVRSSGIIKRKFNTDTTINNLTYYTNSNQYLDSRNKTFEQNEFHFVRKGDTSSVPGTAAAVDNVYASNTVSRCYQHVSSLYIPVYYKPSNSKFAQQGGVSASSQIQRRKYDTITDAGAKLQSSYGKETANAFSYSTTNSSIYSLKQRTGYPNKKTPIFSKVNGDLQCNTCVIPNITL
jgi:hypothetical protein